MAGNMWNAFSYSVVFKVALSLPMDPKLRYMNYVVDKRKQDAEEAEEEEQDGDNDDESSD